MGRVHIRDISPRLTFQFQAASTQEKVELVDRLIDCGVPAIEVSSFVHPKMVPGLADAEQVFSRVKRPAGVSLECCVGNVTGLKRAIDSGAHAAWFLLAADEAFAKANIGRNIEDSLLELERMREVAARADIRLGTYLIAVFGGPVGLPRGPEQVSSLAARLTAMGIDEWILADSCGYAAPPQVRNMVQFASSHTAMEKLRVQVHDSRGMGLANIAELVALGVKNIDTSLAGSGGHPAAPGASVGGVCTEDAVQMLDLMGVDSGIDLSALIATANWLNDLLGGREKGFTRKVGKVPASALELKAFKEAQSSFSWNRD